jgi:putative endonuclease
MYHVYALKSITRNYIYVGFTSDLERRINEHNKGYNKTTKPYAPFELIYSEELETRESARKREKYWKSGTGKRRLKKLIEDLKT